MTELHEFLIELAQDPARQLAFSSAPEAVLADSGLSPANQALLLRRDGRLLHAALAAQGVNTAATFGDPGPDPMPDPDPPFPQRPPTEVHACA